MIFHFAGEYDGNPDSLPQKDPFPPSAVQFRECDSTKKLGMISLAGCMVLFAVLFIVVNLVSGSDVSLLDNLIPVGLALVVNLVVHEPLHGIWFKGDAYMYHNLKQSMLFITGTEDMSKARFICMGMFPALVLGFIPFIVFLIFPNLIVVGLFGVIGIASGFGDYMNIYWTLTQVPNGAKVFLSGVHTFWYESK